MVSCQEEGRETSDGMRSRAHYRLYLKNDKVCQEVS